MKELPNHLGGHSDKTNIDYGAFEWIMNTFNPTSFLDIGCGPGGMIDLALENNLDAFGIDGDFTVERNNPSKVLIHDFTQGPAPLDKRYDIGWSVEFVEHVYEEHIPDYIKSFQLCDVLIMSFAPIGHGGYHHVNENTEEYWIKTLEDYGFVYHQKFTEDLRNSSTMNRKKSTANPKKLRKAFVHLRGLVFINQES